MRHIHQSVHSDLLAILTVAAIVFAVGSGIYESVHAPMQARIFAGPASTI
jgi:hypothetical protein